jgi:uncharacterized protein
MGIQSERTSARGVSTARFLVRRFAALLAIGICHMLLIWNGDILALYAVCGLLLIPFVSLSTRRLAALGVAIIALSPYMPFFGSFFPTEASMRAHAAIAARVYATGSFSEIMALRKSETVEFILPLLLNSFPRTVGLMLLGIAAWRSGILQQPGEHRKLLMVILVAAGGLGALTTTLHVWSKETGSSPPSALDLLYPYSPVLLACAYGACLLLWMRPVRMLAAAGRMALTNYLAQSVIFSLLFYGHGFGLFGKLGPAAAALIGLTVYAAQLTASQWWLERFPFGPAELVWRWLTYGPRESKPSRD